MTSSVITALLTVQIAKANWNKDRKAIAIEYPCWPMPAWSKAQAWEKRPYLNAAKEGKHPDDH